MKAKNYIKYLFYRKPFWSAIEVFTAMSTLLYSHQRYSINKNLLKSICCIFPFVLKNYPTVFTFAHGDSLLLLIEKFIKTLDEIMTYDMEQLLWIMVKGTDLLKKTALSCWLQNGDLDILLQVLDIYDYSSVLFDLLVDESVEEILIQR